MRAHTDGQIRETDRADRQLDGCDYPMELPYWLSLGTEGSGRQREAALGQQGPQEQNSQVPGQHPRWFDKMPKNMSSEIAYFQTRW